MRSYAQYCAVAKALDIVGDRWTLLIVRELLLGPARYGELQDGLPGVATNLLADRLAHLEASGVVERRHEGRYQLTAWGQHLAQPIYALARWAAPLMNQMADNETFKTHWLAAPVAFIFGGVNRKRPPLQIEIRTGDQIVTMQSKEGEVQLRPGPAATPDLVLSGPPDVIIGALSGRLDQRQASRQGLKALGDIAVLDTLRQPDWLSGPETCDVPTIG
jgi:DNA-binding HxlR family transcriptional regulator